LRLKTRIRRSDISDIKVIVAKGCDELEVWHEGLSDSAFFVDAIQFLVSHHDGCAIELIVDVILVNTITYTGR